MRLRFLIDEQLRGPLWRAIVSHNLGPSQMPIDATCVGEPGDQPLGSTDPAILHWAQREGRVLVSLDKNTMPPFLAEHLAAGQHSPGVLLVRRGASIAAVVEFLALAGEVSLPEEWAGMVNWIP